MQPAQDRLPGAKESGYQPKYESLVLVGYSLGGVLVRAAALEAARTKPARLDKLKLVLFAPAHLGARAGHLLADKEGDIFRRPKAALRWFVAPLEVLVAGNGFLRDVRRETEARASANAELIPLITLFGEEDAWVEIGGYDCDKPHRTAAGRSHENVQKADGTYHVAVDCIAEAHR